MRNNKAIAIIAGLTTAAALSVLGLLAGPRPTGPDPAPHRTAGRLLAQETLSRLAPGGRVSVITRDTTDFKQPAADILFHTLKRSLSKAGATIGSVRALEVDPLRLVEVPSGDFMELIAKTPAGSVIVSLMGPPILSPDQCLQLGNIKPKIVAFCPGNLPAQIDLRFVFAQGLLDAAVVSRRPTRPSPGAPAAAPAQDLFQTVTAANVGSLYGSGGPVL